MAAVLGSRRRCAVQKEELGLPEGGHQQGEGCFCPPESSPTLEVSRASSPQIQDFKSSLYCSRSIGCPCRVRPGPGAWRGADFPQSAWWRRYLMGSWKTRPTYWPACAGQAGHVHAVDGDAPLVHGPRWPRRSGAWTCPRRCRR